MNNLPHTQHLTIALSTEIVDKMSKNSESVIYTKNNFAVPLIY